jgi:Arc/MetJ-type ribon-helix-helix transcriptional regulator
MDRAVGEYADLVRALERRQSLPSSPPPPPPPKESPAHPASASNGKHAEKYGGRVSTLEALRERKEELRKLAGEFEGASEVLRDEIGKLRGELDEARAELEAERKAAEEERARLSNALTELELLKHDDNAAAKMVSRYMYAQSRSSHRLPYQNVPPPHALGSSHKPQRTRYKSRSSLSPRAT